MPGYKFSKKVPKTGKRARQWDKVYQSAKRRGASPGSAIRQASGAVKRSTKK